MGKTVGVIDGCDNQLQVLLEEIAVENTFGVRRGAVFKSYMGGQICRNIKKDV